MAVIFFVLFFGLICNKISYSSCTENPNLLNAHKEFSSYELIIPHVFNSGRRVSSSAIENGHLNNLLLHLPLRDHGIWLELHLNKNLFPVSYIEKYYTPDGNTVIRKPDGHNTTNHCYYHGVIKGDLNSTAAVSTCNGIRGMIVSKHEVYHIEPQELVTKGIHVVFKDSERIATAYKCSSNGTAHARHAGMSSLFSPRSNRLKRSLYWPYDSNEETKIVELYVANDNLQYKNQGSSVDKVISRTKEIINVASSLYKKVNTHLALVGIEIWTNKDRIKIVENADTTMNSFLEYRRISISPKHKNDNAQLITGHTFGQGVIGKAPINTICSWQYSGGVNMDHSNLVGPVATTVAHEMGHNFGLAHDTNLCKCPDSKCIMNSNSGGTQPHHWSSCSLDQFADSFYQGMDYCLHDLPEKLFNGPVCGNGFLEDGEQCDCGTPESCNSKCCNASTCTLFANATCATGKCCDLNSCKLKPAAVLCRDAIDTCDLPEYCHGNTEHCPLDTYKQDGTDCEIQFGQSYCYKGMCRNGESQCHKLWGESGHKSHDECFRHFNTMGVANGNCGFDWVNKTFQKCRPQDVMCGMLHCTHRNEKLVFWKEALSYTMPEGWITIDGVRKNCYGAILDVGLDYEDPGMIPEGAKCGDSKLCHNQKCVDVDEVLAGVQCPDCNNNGVCNSLGQCHCDDGYGPPDCKYAGHGGSEHSGSEQVMKGSAGLAAGLAFLFIFLVLAVSLILIFGYRKRRDLKTIWLFRTKSEKYRSICRAQPAIHHEEKTFKPQRPAPKAPVHKLSFSKAKAPPVEANGIKRAPSFRPEDITQLKLESTTNKYVDNLRELPVRLRSPTLEAARADHDQVHFYRSPPVEERDPPPSYNQTCVGAHGNDYNSTPPGRPPPPKRYLYNNSRHSGNIANISSNVDEDTYENVKGTVGYFDEVPLNSPTEENYSNEIDSPPPRPPRPKSLASSTEKPSTIHTVSEKFEKPSGVANIKSRFEPDNTAYKHKPGAKRYPSNGDTKKTSTDAADIKVTGKKPAVASKPSSVRNKPALKAKPSLNLNINSSSEC